DLLDRRAAFQFEIAVLIAKRKARGEIAIGAGGAYGDGVGVGKDGTGREIDHRKIDLRAIVVAAAGLPAVSHPEGLLAFADGGVAVRIEGLIFDELVGGG